ncbi:MAG: nucleotidyl transferase AbiEii/AbiGii toxin family protein [Candidatus Enteromonas sp.]|nr:nucleotidyl transferase AbiEii/AbiGii toxin family protein [Candidatus Enteromonas sp.]
MNSVIEAMLAKYNPQNNEEREHAMKEIIQEIALAGLSRGGFFEKAAFYGGTCLRIFHGLNRFSEDLDFALLEKGTNFKFDDYFPALQKEFQSYGMEMSIETKKKDGEVAVQSAFLKGNTLMLMMSFFPKSEDAKRVVPNQKIKIKLEIDTDNPSGGTTEFRYKMLPAPYEIQIFDEPTLFAGKIHAILCRSYQNHVKGRDYYDYLFYIGKGSKFNLQYLENKLKNTGGIIGENEVLTLEKVKELLKAKFESVDYESAKKDVSPFIQDKNSIRFWKETLFTSTLSELVPNDPLEMIR